MRIDLIAPCGMNCGVCKAYLREENACPGCKFQDAYEKSYKRKCALRSCKKKKRYCFECGDYCARLKRLDKRYSTKYGMSMIDNLEFIKFHGIKKFVESEKTRWACPGGVISCHDKKCYKNKD